MDKISNTIKAIRADSRLSQMQFAKKIGMKQSAYSMLESGTNKPTLDVIRKIITEFKVSPAVFFSDEIEIIKDNIHIVNNDYSSIENDIKPPQNQRDYIKLLINQSKEKHLNTVANYYNDDPIGRQTKRLLELKEKYTRRFNREAAIEDEALFYFSNLIDHLGDTIEMVMDVYLKNINSRPDPFETSQYFDLQNDTANIPESIEYTTYKESVVKWLQSIREYEPVLNEFYNQCDNFLKSISNSNT